MRLLLDTHIIIWWFTNDELLPSDIKEVLDHEPDVYVSAASIWEMAIKQSIGKLQVPDDLIGRIHDEGFHELMVNFAHASAAGKLPFIHRDPFDRMLIAQAKCERLTFVTADPECKSYDVPLLPA